MTSAEQTEREIIRPLLQYINDTPSLLSLLYDCNLLPEQTTKTANYKTTLLIAEAWKREAAQNRIAGLMEAAN